MSKSIMTKISASQPKNQESSKPPAQAMEESKIVLKEEHKAIYDDFIQLLRNKAQSKELGEDDKAVLAFMLDQNQTIFKIVNPKDIKLLSEENFCQFLLSILKKIREKKLANEENFKNGKIKAVVDDCVADIRGTEAKDSLVKLVGLPFGIKIDPKNISGSFLSGLKEKIPFLGKDKKEEDEPPLSDEQMATAFLRKSLLPVALCAFTTLIFGTGLIMLSIAVIGLLITEIVAVKSLFSNNKKGTLYDPSSQDNTEKRAKLNEKICDGINKILGTPVEKAKGSEQPTSVSEQISQGKEKSEQQPVPEQISQGNNRGNEKSEQQDRSWAGKENKRREETIEQQPSKT